MLKYLLNWIFRKKEVKQEQIEPKDISLSYEEAVPFIQEHLRKHPSMEISEVNAILNRAMAGDKASVTTVKQLIYETLDSFNVTIVNMDLRTAASKLYAQIWGLGPVDEYYLDETVDEIRVNSPEHIYLVRRGQSIRAPVRFKDEDEVEEVIKRMFLEDIGVSLDRSNPRVESVRKDGSRLTATCFPVTRTWTFALRKHGTFDTTLENYIISGTLDQGIWNKLSILIRGRASILVSGNVGAGKTTLARKLVGELHPNLRILVIGKDSELLIAQHYPDRDVVEMEEHPQVGATMKALFDTILRYSPDVIITEEFRNAVEALEAIRACTRGLPGSMATCHFNSAEEAVEGTGLMLLEEGLNLPLELAKLRVARAFNIVIQLFGDTISGVKKLLSVTEVKVNEHGAIEYRNLVRWSPAGDSFLGKGTWIYPEQPSNRLIAHLLRNITPEELEKAGWGWHSWQALTGR